MPSRLKKYLQEQERRQQQEYEKLRGQASWDRLRSEPWRVSGGGCRAIGSGRCRIQILCRPPFTPASFWEVCQRESEWLLYTATLSHGDWSPDSWIDVKVLGYEPVKFDGDKLNGYFQRLTSLMLPLAPLLDDSQVRDGTTTHLTLFGDLDSEARFQWWSDYPPAWKPLVDIADEMLAAFGTPPSDFRR